ncbi:hypothetical protein KOAAANKH_01394 [Brevundimonas sp. NIBR10]|uniref:extracellular catalytic domain type 1 short-chain-length polyhydroxyalkanoate depolymerase n=1 Tax=Brevundimonas sp. NIBR10 TaxID=3015997 RepID=UPI0022F1666E|nr:PHB depolymerase family esterase [Brevundimonas sp. NIBR10]WGM46523.1 hypothetical protein KOAAANKH_01394 [Brevundimonas sp. NIBR10]
MTGLGQTLATLARRRLDPVQAGGRGPARMLACDFAPNPGALKMLIHVPAGLAPGAPLVVVLHGCTQRGEAYADGAGWLTLADRFGFVVLSPEQTAANNPNRCFNWFQTGDTTRDAGEAASIAAMTRKAIADHAIDPDRVFVTGLSAGGAMTAVLLATYPELFAGGAVVAGLPHGAAASMSEAFGAMMKPRARDSAAWGEKVRAASDHAGPWPRISIWHGTADATVRPASADALIQQWTDVHGLTGAPHKARTPQGRVFEVWMSPSGEPLVENHRIPGLAHGTPLKTQGPDGVGTAGPFLLDVGISSSLEIAMGWGIAESEANSRPASVTDSDVAPAHGSAGKHRRSPQPAPDGTAPQRPNAVTSVIENALRAAGLMR